MRAPDRVPDLQRRRKASVGLGFQWKIFAPYTSCDMADIDRAPTEADARQSLRWAKTFPSNLRGRTSANGRKMDATPMGSTAGVSPMLPSDGGLDPRKTDGHSSRKTDQHLLCIGEGQ
jgi:hypothetical protein